MGKSIKCSDLGINCGWSATANNENELLKKITQHAEQHGFTEIPFEWEAKIKAAIKDV
jgi:predicted small metal-binding protein